MPDVAAWFRRLADSDAREDDSLKPKEPLSNDHTDTPTSSMAIDYTYLRHKLADTIYGIEEPIESDMWDEWKTTNPIALKLKTWYEEVETDYYAKKDGVPMLTRTAAESNFDLTSAEGQETALKSDLRLIYYIDNPTDQQKWLVLNADPEWIKYFRRAPTQKMKEYAIEHSPKVFKILWDNKWYNSDDRKLHETRWGMSYFD